MGLATRDSRMEEDSSDSDVSVDSTVGQSGYTDFSLLNLFFLKALL